MSWKIVVTESGLRGGWDNEAKRVAENGGELVFLNSADHNTIKEACKDADAVLIGYAQCDADIINAMTKCKSISRVGIGVNNVDIAAATAKGIKVMNQTTYCIEEVSDTSVALFYSLARAIPFVRDNVKNGEWGRGAYEPVRIKDKTFAFCGFGKIARRAYEKIKNCGMKVLVYDPYIDAQTIASFGAEKADFDTVVEQADFISLNLPLTDENAGMFNKDIFKKMKNTAYIINTSRGGLINEKDLIEAVNNGEIGGAGLDVIADEKYDPANPILNTDRIIVTPHLAYYSQESEADLRYELFSDIIRVNAKGEDPIFWVNKKEMTK